LIKTLFRNIVPSKNDRELKKLQPIVDRINYLENHFLTKEEVEKKTALLRDSLGETVSLAEIFPELAILGKKELEQKTATCRKELAGGKLLSDILPDDFRIVSDQELKAMTDRFRIQVEAELTERLRERLENAKEIRKKMEDRLHFDEIRELVKERLLDRRTGDPYLEQVKLIRRNLVDRVKNALEEELLLLAEGLRDEGVIEELQTILDTHSLDDIRHEMDQIIVSEIKKSLDEYVKEEATPCLDKFLPEAFAVVREASKRILGMRHFDVQLIGGIVLHQGKIAEMKTGEGKTLSATLPAYLNALLGQGVHIITVNDYLAERDCNWMGQIYEFLGLTTGVILHDMEQVEKRDNYYCDICYGTNNEFGFDYLRDNLADNKSSRVQRQLHYSIVDEVDSILIDEARTPLIISGEVEHDLRSFSDFKSAIQSLIQKQGKLVAKLFQQAVEFDKNDDPDSREKYVKLLQVERGNPKYRPFLDYIAQKKETKKSMMDLENEYITNKTTTELEEGLLYIVREKEHNVDLTEEGRIELSHPVWHLLVIPELWGKFLEADIASGEELAAPPEEKNRLVDQYLDSEGVHGNVNQANLSILLALYEELKKVIYYQNLHPIEQEDRCRDILKFYEKQHSKLVQISQIYPTGLFAALEEKVGILHNDSLKKEAKEAYLQDVEDKIRRTTLGRTDVFILPDLSEESAMIERQYSERIQDLVEEMRSATASVAIEGLDAGFVDKNLYERIVKEEADLSDIYSEILKKLEQFLDSSFTGVWLKAEGDSCKTCLFSEECTNKRHCLHMIASCGNLVSLPQRGERIPLSGEKIPFIRSPELPWLADSPELSSWFFGSDTASAEQIKRSVFIPLRRDEDLIGMIVGLGVKQTEVELEKTLPVFSLLGSRIPFCSALHGQKNYKLDNIRQEYQEKTEKVHVVTQLLRAYTLFEKDVEYIVTDQSGRREVMIVDEFTGRMMPGRRYSDGLHQAIEAKEGVQIARTSQTIATITLQNLFLLYNKLAGMTGTADTEAAEFHKIYSLDVVVIPTNEQVTRRDFDDVIYRTEKEKNEAIIFEIMQRHLRGQPILVGTTSVEKSEQRSAYLVAGGDREKNLLQKVIPSIIESPEELNNIWEEVAANINGEFSRARLFLQAGRKTEDDIREMVKEIFKIAANSAQRGEWLGKFVPEVIEQVTQNFLSDEKDILTVLKEIDYEGNLLYEVIKDRFIERIEQNGRFILERLKVRKKAKSGEQMVFHHVLNAKHHKKEAQIVSTAGWEGNITIATNMAGRGTDIMLGERDSDTETLGHAGITYLGGLHILGTERHESRRIDNQLRGRSGRQGDPGTSRFYLSLEDDLLRIFGSERISNIMLKLGMEEGQPIEHGMVSKSIENAQKKVEAHNFEIRKNLLEYDEVNNLQRKFVYNLRNEIINSPNIKEFYCAKIAPEVVDNLMENYIPPGSYSEEWDITGLRKELRRFTTYISEESLFKENQTEEGLRDELIDCFVQTYHQKEKDFKNYIKFAGVFGIEDEEEEFAEVIKRGILKTIDRNWMDTLAAMDHMKEGIGLRGYGQKDPLQEYKKEGFAIFSEMMANINADAIEGLLKLSFGRPEESIYHATQEKLDVDWDADFRSAETKQGPQAAYKEEQPVQKTVIREGKKVGRNDPCPCGSGRKYKKCCLAKETVVTS